MSICFICLVSQKQPIHPAPTLPHTSSLSRQHIQGNQPSLPSSACFSLLQHLHHKRRKRNKTSNGQPHRHKPFIDCRISKPFKMPAKWDDTRERDLLEELFFVLSSRQPLSQEDKDAVVEGMQQRGYQNLRWNAIR